MKRMSITTARSRLKALIKEAQTRIAWGSESEVLTESERGSLLRKSRLDMEALTIAMQAMQYAWDHDHDGIFK